ncbi:MAG: hypothetical protein Q4D20_11220, partial [Clostridia bacterium]|nr:hypothetical protein [Clostridia bacterium]
MINVPVVLDKITTGKAQTISRVTITVDDSLGYTNGDDTGTELKITGIPYASQTVCDDLYNALKNVVYAPFSASKTCFDPCTELGDWVIIGDEVRSVIYKQSITLGVDFRANIEAPGKDETEDEFPYLGEVDRLKSRTEELKKYVEDSKDEINSKIEQTRESILLEVSGTYATGESVSASLEVLGKEISSKVSSNDLKTEVSSQISQTASTIRLEASKIVWTADKSSMTEEGVLTASGANITGEITAESGTIGGFSIKKEALQYGDMSDDENRFLLYPSGSASTYCTGNKTTKGWTIVSGSNFGVLKDGTMFATNATITGKVTANEGKIGGLYIGSNGELARSMPEAKDATTEKWIPNAYTFLAYPYNENNDIWTVAGKNVRRPAMLLGKNFCVTTAGKLYATGAEIAGNITASKLTLAKNAKFVDEDGEDVIPEMPDTSVFIEKDGAITEVTDPDIIAQIEAGTYEGTSKYFAVDNDGLLVAANAVV